MWLAPLTRCHATLAGRITSDGWSLKGEEMNCPRCRGLMVPDDLLDLQDEAGQRWFVARRCLICGEVLDPVILKNRSARPKPMVERGRHRPKVQCVSTGEHRARRSDPYRELGDDPGGV